MEQKPVIVIDRVDLFDLGVSVGLGAVLGGFLAVAAIAAALAALELVCSAVKRLLGVT